MFSKFSTNFWLDYSGKLGLIGFGLDCCGDDCIDFNENYLSLEPGGIGRHLVFLAVQGVLYFTALLLVESHVVHLVCYTLRRHCSPTYQVFFFAFIT